MDDKHVFDALLCHTVHAFLFQEDDEEQLAVADLHAAEDSPALVPSILVQEEPGTSDEADYARHCKRVLECQHWRLDELEREKAAMKAYLKHHANEQRRHATQPSEELYRAFETYALLKLFLLAHTSSSYAKSLEPLPQDGERFLRALHVQLELYAKYFELSCRRKVSSPQRTTWRPSASSTSCSHVGAVRRNDVGFLRVETRHREPRVVERGAAEHVHASLDEAHAAERVTATAAVSAEVDGDAAGEAREREEEQRELGVVLVDGRERLVGREQAAVGGARDVARDEQRLVDSRVPAVLGLHEPREREGDVAQQDVAVLVTEAHEVDAEQQEVGDGEHVRDEVPLELAQEELLLQRLGRVEAEGDRELENAHEELEVPVVALHHAERRHHRRVRERQEAEARGRDQQRCHRRRRRRRFCDFRY